MRTLITLLALTVPLTLGARLTADEPKGNIGLVERVQDLNLTTEQEAKITDIMKEFRSKNAEARSELASAVKDEIEKVQAVLTPEQREKLESMKEERQEHREEGLAQRIAHLKDLDLTDDEVAKFSDIRKDFHPKIAMAVKSMDGLLSDEQRQTRSDGLKAGKNHAEVLASLKLADDQKEKVAAAAKEVSGLVREEMEKVRDVLSASQKEKLQELQDERKEQVRDRRAHRVANLKELNLTDEQKTKLADIRKEFRPKIHEAGNKLRGLAREELDMIVVVLKT
jgi:Spy/CpxP family protein refolding chaperone